MRTAGVSADHEPASTTLASGRRLERGRADREQGAHRNRCVDGEHCAEGQRDRPRDGALRVADLLAEGGDPGVPGEGEAQQPGRLQDVVRPDAPGGPQSGGGRRPAQQAGQHHQGEHEKHEQDEDPGQPGGLGDPAQVDHRERDDRRDGERPGGGGHGVRPDGQRHRRAAGGLADDEAEPGQVSPERPELAPAVDVGPARAGVERGELCGRQGVAGGHHRGDRQTGQQQGAGRRGGGGECGEDPGAEHGAEPDHDRVAGAEPAGEGGFAHVVKSAGRPTSRRNDQVTAAVPTTTGCVRPPAARRAKLRCGARSRRGSGVRRRCPDRRGRRAPSRCNACREAPDRRHHIPW